MALLVSLRHTGVRAGLASALLFGAAAPLAQPLLGDTGPWLMAALLYLGSGLGLLAVRRAMRRPSARLARRDAPWLVGAIVCGGVVAPVLLMVGLAGMSAAGASLLLTAESVFTALLAWVLFRENVDRRVLLGMAAIASGAIVLAWPGSSADLPLWPSVAVLGACLGWAIDNNLTRKVSLTDATWLAATKGWAAGTVNLLLALVLQSRWPGPDVVVAAMVLGFASYGVSLVLFIVALRHLGTARAGAYFSVAPFIGAVIAVALGAPVTPTLLVAGALMMLGVWLHLTERHGHQHTHEAVEHDHSHTHDAHHRHRHPKGEPVDPARPHRHLHRHEPGTHSHPHYPDAHHRHGH